MILHNDTELAYTRSKLARLETMFKTLQRQASKDKKLHDATLQSIKKYINQFKEEIARYECGIQTTNRNGCSQSRKLENDVQLENTRKKLRQLESLCEKGTDGADTEELRRISRQSLKRFINQLKEEIARYECRQEARP